MSRSKQIAVAVAAAVLAGAQASSADAARNPYTGEQVCGPGYAFAMSTPLYSFHGGVKLATFDVTHNAATGRTCVVLLKNRAVGTPSQMSLRVARVRYKKPTRWSAPDKGRFSYYAGPLYFKGPSYCALMLGGMTVDGGRSGYYGNSTRAVCH